MFQQDSVQTSLHLLVTDIIFISICTVSYASKTVTFQREVSTIFSSKQNSVKRQWSTTTGSIRKSTNVKNYRT